MAKDPAKGEPQDGTDESGKGERIAKRMARAGICSRREAEAMIAAGRVKVDGTVLTSPAHLVTDASRILVDGKPVKAAEQTRVWRYNKPRGLVTTHSDPQGRPTVFERLPQGLPRVISVGRLDLTSEGLLLLTNDGALARRLELPSNAWLRRYRVRVNGMPDAATIERLGRGIEVEGVKYGSITVVVEKAQGANTWLTVTLHEGKNREIRRALEHMGHMVTRLIRVSYGPFQLGMLEHGEVEEVPAKVLRDQLGAKGKSEGAAARAKAGDKPAREGSGRGSRATWEKPVRDKSTRPPRAERAPIGERVPNTETMSERPADASGSGPRSGPKSGPKSGRRSPRQESSGTEFSRSERPASAPKRSSDVPRPARKPSRSRDGEATADAPDRARKPAGRSSAGKSLAGKSPSDRSPSGKPPGGKSPGGKSPGGKSPGGAPRSPRPEGRPARAHRRG